MKHVVIPTDFTIGSLQPVHAAMMQFPGEKIRITLLHLLELPDGIGDLLFRAARREPTHLISAEFRKACEVIRNKYGSRLTDICTDFRFGSTKAYICHLMEGLGADAIAMDPDYELTQPSRQSIPMMPLLQCTGLPFIELHPELKEKSAGNASISNLLLREETRRPVSVFSEA